MSWQDAAVAVIVGCAVAFLVLRVVGRRRSRKPAETFVPLSSLKSPRDDRSDRSGCH